MRSWRAAACLWLLSLVSGVACRCILDPSGRDFFEQAQQFARLKQFDRAELALRQVLARDSQRTDARVLLGQLAHVRGDWATVAAAFRDVPDSDSRAGDIRLAEGDAWLKLNRTVPAEECWLRAGQLSPNSPLPRRRLIYLYALQIRREAWMRLLWDLYDRDEAGLREMIQLMIAKHVVWGAEEAGGVTQTYAAADPQDTHSRRAAAIYLLHAGRIQEARIELESLRVAHPDDRETWFALIECYLANGDTEAADESLNQMPEDARSDWRWHKCRGALTLQARRYDDAISDFAKALSDAPFDRDVRYKMAQSLRAHHDFDAADRHAQLADRLAKIDRLCHSLYHQRTPSLLDIRQLARFCEELGLIEEARGRVRVGLTIDVSDPVLLSARDRLASRPATSSRHTP